MRYSETLFKFGLKVSDLGYGQKLWVGKGKRGMVVKIQRRIKKQWRNL